MTPAAITRAADILRERAGFRRDPALNGRLTRCLTDAATAEGCSLDDYVARLTSDDSAVQRLVDRVTIQESQFFRDDAQFKAFSRCLLPGLRTSTIWSAGCANGQEAWTLAILLDEHGRTDCSILATDISTTALERAARGFYSPRELRGLSPDRIARYFVARDEGYEIHPSLRRLVSFAHHNLAADAPPVAAGTCEVAFCRNVLIYLTDDEITAVLDRVARALGVGGHLFLGYSESLWRLPSRFALRRLDSTFVYEVEDRSRPTVEPAPRRAPRRERAPARSATRRPSAITPVEAPASPLPDGEDYLRRGQEAASSGDLAAAVVEFRKAAYLRPDDPAIVLHLAFTLEAMDDIDGARPWFRRALEAMSAIDPSSSVFEGWSSPELSRVLHRKVALPAVER